MIAFTAAGGRKTGKGLKTKSQNPVDLLSIKDLTARESELAR